MPMIKRLFILIVLVAFPSIVHAGMLQGIVAGGAVVSAPAGTNLIPNNPGFESALASAQVTTNWWPVVDDAYGYGTGTAIRTAVSGMTNTYAGYVKAAPAQYLGCVEDQTITDEGTCLGNYYNWDNVSNVITSGLWFRVAKTAIDSSTGKLTFDFKVLGAYTGDSGSARYEIRMMAYNASGTVINDYSVKGVVGLTGGLNSTSSDNSIKLSNPTVGTKYTFTNYDAKSRIIFSLNSGKTWATDVSYVLMEFCTVSPDHTLIPEALFDNFR
jgi:hypothetical protein